MQMGGRGCLPTLCPTLAGSASATRTAPAALQAQAEAERRARLLVDEVRMDAAGSSPCEGAEGEGGGAAAGSDGEFGEFAGDDDGAWDSNDDGAEPDADDGGYAPLEEDDDDGDEIAVAAEAAPTESIAAPSEPHALRAALAIARASHEAAAMEAEYLQVRDSAARAHPSPAGGPARADHGEEATASPFGPAHAAATWRPTDDGEAFEPFASDERAAARARAAHRRRLVEAYTSPSAGAASGEGGSRAEPRGFPAPRAQQHVERLPAARAAQIKASMEGLALKPPGAVTGRGTSALDAMVAVAVARGRSYLKQQDALAASGPESPSTST